MKSLFIAASAVVGVGVVSVISAPTTAEAQAPVQGRPSWDITKTVKYPTTVVAPKAKQVPRKPVIHKSVEKRRDVGITVSSYAWCPGSAQSCIDAGRLTGYNGKYLAGHNYMGYQWLPRVAEGTTVRVTTGPLTGTYRVYGHLRLTRQGGSFPNTAGADLVMQSCEGSGTGFSLARRIK